MQIAALGIHESFLVKIERSDDTRGFFARTFCVREFLEAGIPTETAQASISFSARRGTVRGLHFQWPPSREGKLVRCLRGRLYDVLLDLRPASPTYLQHVSVDLDEESRDAVFIPHGVAHGFQTLTDATEVQYQMTDVYAPHLAAGVRWNDPQFAISWPLKSNVVISARDASYTDFDRHAFESELVLRVTSSP